ncbi:LysM peptidoglycan-binding domain-containing protein, partial [Paenibacillus sepulcri]|nr:LysM peptidoglycan-binding domain-containing protein [Paenibacillus sepulcri]
HETVYCVQPGDSLLGIAELFSAAVPGLAAANPHLDLKKLIPGQLITVPAGSYGRIIDARAEYGHAELQRDLDAMESEYPFLERTVIGYSVLHKPIYAVRLGEGPRKIQINAAMHANEWITAPLLMSFVEDAADACAHGRNVGGVDIRKLIQGAEVWFVPLVNPDGVELVQEGMRQDHPFFSELLQWNRQSQRFAKWKANIRGVDLNDQFPAFWEEEVRRREASGPGPRDYPGPAPLSEPEAQALYSFTQEREF